MNHSNTEKKIIDKNMVVIAKVGSTYRLSGELKLYIYSDSIEKMLSYGAWWIKTPGAGEWQQLSNEEVYSLGDKYLIKFSDINTPEDASKYINSEIAIHKSSLPQLDDNEYYWRDLMGLNVSNNEGYCFGQVVDILDTGSNEVIIVKDLNTNRSKEILIPFANPYIVKVNMITKEIIVEWDESYS